jgi:nucleotide-binding universal stress UspA family protein
VRILAATDFSAAADRAMRRAASLASSLSGELHLIHVMPPADLLEKIFVGDLQSEAARIRTRAEKALQERATLLTAGFSIKPACKLVQGRAHEAIAQTGRSLDAKLIVVGARGEHEGESREDSVGGTAFKLVARCPIPTLLVRHETYRPYDHVLACAKGVVTDRAVIEWANRVSPASLIHVLSAYMVPYERRLMEWGASQATIDVYATRERDERTRLLSQLLDEFGLMAARARLHVARGEPLELILSHAAQWECDLVIVGQRAHAPEGLAGSIARRVASRAATDVLVVSTKTISRTAELMNSHFG